MTKKQINSLFRQLHNGVSRIEKKLFSVATYDEVKEFDKIYTALDKLRESRTSDSF